MTANAPASCSRRRPKTRAPPRSSCNLDSPGGGVTASDRIYHSVGLLAKKKPVIASFAGVSASGGYYIAAAAHAIVAQPTTITGSIGVVAARFVIGPLLAKLGLSPQVVTRGAHADMLDISRPFSDDERRIFDAELERTYKDFVALVAAGRKKTADDILPLAGGRVWTGRDALERGLVDRLGGFEVAVEEAKTRLGPLGDKARSRADGAAANAKRTAFSLRLAGVFRTHRAPRPRRAARAGPRHPRNTRPRLCSLRDRPASLAEARDRGDA